MNALRALALVSCVFSAGANAATLNVVGGELMGATNVNVGGNFYDVQFVDGSCIEVFSGCDAIPDFDFITQPDATAASQALLGQVLIDTPAGSFDSQPDLVFGCPDGFTNCGVSTPYGFSPGGRILVSIAVNMAGPDSNQTPTEFTQGSNFSNNVYAVWSPSPVPVPAAVWLLGSALGILGLARRKMQTA